VTHVLLNDAFGLFELRFLCVLLNNVMNVIFCDGLDAKENGFAELSIAVRGMKEDAEGAVVSYVRVMAYCPL
jgi:hypothetical protein